MYSLFTNIIKSHGSIIKPASFDYIKRIYQKELQDIITYYSSRTFYTTNTNILVKLINTGYVPIEYDINKYNEISYTRSIYVSKLYNITSGINYGKIHEGAFYGEDNKEILLYNDDYFDKNLEAANWKNIKAVNVLLHPISDLGLILPIGKRNSIESGLCVISINLPLLLLQFRQYMLEQLSIGKSNNLSINKINHFVTSYVFPNMMYSHLELVIMNRLMNLFYGRPMGKALKKHPFTLSDYSKKLDNVLLNVINNLDYKNSLYSNYLKTIPSVSNEDMQVSLIMPDIVNTRQAWWALFTSRLPIIKFLVDIGDKAGVYTNGTYINKLKIDIRRLQQDHVYKNMLPKELLYQIEATLNYLLRI
jgi:hypothetical protein